MPGLGASFGRGGATTFQENLAESDCVLIMGSNMAEAHPVGFRWPLKAKERGGVLIHVDPRFTRTSALADLHVPIRAGTDIAFLGGLIRYVLEERRWFQEYVLHYTNAATIIEEGFQDTEDLDGLFSGFDDQLGIYDPSAGQWAYAGENGGASANAGGGESGGDGEHAAGSGTRREGSAGDVSERGGGEGGEGGGGSDGGNGGSAGEPAERHPDEEIHGYGLMGGHVTHREPRHQVIPERPLRDPTLTHPRCVLQLLRRHFARYTPEKVAEICGCTAEQVVRVAEHLCANSGRERTSAIVYAVGWTQHTVGVQMIRAAGILQALLGNMGRPGGGIMAMRGHVSIQGSTDISTLYDMLPGYLPMPIAQQTHEQLDGYVEHERFQRGGWGEMKAYVVSQLKAWYGDAATAENQFGFGWLPRLHGDYSHVPFFQKMSAGEVKGYFLFGQNPAGGGPNARQQRHALRQLDWLVVADWYEHESAVFWKHDPGGPPPHDIKTEVFFLPAASIAAKEGTFTNTQRLLQWHDRAVDDFEDCRSDLWYVYHLGKRLKQLYADSTDPKDAPIQQLTWDYESEEPIHLPDGTMSRHQDEPEAERVLQEINGFDLTERDPRTSRPKLLAAYDELKDDGSTACGCWIYCGVFPEHGRNLARGRQRVEGPVQSAWGWAWPKNVRVLYNRASADPQGRPWSDRKKLVWWDAAQRRWVGADQPDFRPDTPPDYQPAPDATGLDAIAGDSPFIMKPDGKAWLFAPGGQDDGPFPAHYEAVESPVPNLLYAQQVNPTVRMFEGPLNPLAHTPTAEYPIVATTFRLTEHYLSGPMSRFNSWLAELQPEMFVEISPELAAEKGIRHGGWLTVRSPRGAIEARAMVTRRISPLRTRGRTVHQIGIPFHWGFAGEVVGDQANDLTSSAIDINVSIHEVKAWAVQVEPGRRAGAAPSPTKPERHWPTTEPAPATPASAQPEGQYGR